MKKILFIAGITALIFIVTGTGHAGGGMFNTASDELFMRVDARDAYNRPIESNYAFQAMSFHKAFSMLSTFGVCRWQRSPIDKSTKITRDNTFKLPAIVMSFLYNGRRIPEYIVSGTFSKLGIYLLILMLVLLHESILQTGREPRFRKPVLLE